MNDDKAVKNPAQKITSLQLAPSDEELVHKAQGGDNLAFEQLVTRYEGKIYNLVFHLTGNKTIAKDILQETFIQAYRSIKKFRGKSKFSTWLYKIAVNYCLMQRRKKKITVSLDEYLKTDKDEAPRQIPDWADSPSASIDNSELKEKLNSALDELPDDYRSVVVLSDVEGMSNKEINKVLGLSVSAVKSRLHRVRLFLREKLTGYFTER